jgi:hypothetical protein
VQAPDDLDVFANRRLAVDSRALQHGRKSLQARLTEEGAHAAASDLAVGDRSVAVTASQRVAASVDVEELS